MKKISAILLALVMMLSMVAMAATTITINPNITSGTTDGTETYAAYKIFTAVFEGDVITANTNVAYTIDNTSPFFSTIQNAADANGNKYFTLTQVNSTTTYIVKATSFYTETAAAALAVTLNNVENKASVAVTVTTSYTDGKYTLSLADDDGYYLITSSVGTALVLDTLASSEINTKNGYPTINKQVLDTDLATAAYVETNTSADNGNNATFKLVITIPATATGAMTVHDSMDYLTFVAMTEYTDNPTKTDDTTDDDQTITANTVTDCTDTTHTGAAANSTFTCDVEFVLSDEYVAAHTGEEIEIVYTAKMTGDDNDKNQTAKNTVYLTDGGFTSVEDNVTVYNTDIPVYKYTEDKDGNKTALAGAGFVLKDAAGKYYKYNNNTVSWETTIAENDTTMIYTTDATTGVITFTGLADGTYTLVEHIVPTGYNAAQDVTVVIEDGKVKVNNSEVEQVQVLNSTGTELPSTGGMGTTLFYVVGGLMMAAAVVLLVSKKKVNA